MIFKQALHRELSRTFTATLVVLVTIVMTMMLIRTLGLASKGSVNPQEVFLVMAYSVLGHIPTILTLTLFIALISTLGRLSRDSELVVWLSSGRSLLQFLKPLLQFAAPIFIAIAVLVLLIWPWTNAQMQDLRERFEKRGDIERVVPGQFQESANGKRVFYIDKSNETDSNDSTKMTTGAPLTQGAKHIFIASFEEGHESITSAQSGRMVTEAGSTFFVLDKGQRYERNANGDHKITHFESLKSRVSNAPSTALIGGQPKAMSTLALIQTPSPANLGELAWRISLVLAAFNLVLVALALTRINARGARNSSAMMLALLIFVFYYNMMNVCQVWIADGKVSLTISLLALHGLIFAVGAATLAYKTGRPA